MIVVANVGDKCESCTLNWLYKVRSLEKFLRVVQKIPINLSGAKVEELRDAATVVRRKCQEPKHKGQIAKSQKYEERIAKVDTPVKLQSVPKASPVERSRFVSMREQ